MELLEASSDTAVAVSLCPPREDLLHPWGRFRAHLEPLQLGTPAGLLGAGVGPAGRH